MNVRSFITGIVLIVLEINSNSQAQVPVIKANSRTVDIRDGQFYQRGFWTLMPEVKPDFYLIQRGPLKRRVSFITDLDSISFDVEKGKQYDFIIVLNEKDSCYTRIITENPNKLPYSKTCSNCAGQPDTIPFHMGRDNKIYIIGSINNSRPLELMFDTGSDRVVLSRSGKRKIADLKVDDKELSQGFGGTNEVALSSNNRVAIKGLQWKNVPISIIDKADGDGIIGYPLFDDKVVEIDHDRQLIILHNELPHTSSTYTRLDMNFRQNLPFIPVTLMHGSELIQGLFEFDTGANGAVFVDHGFADKNNLRSLERVSETRSTGMGNNVIYNDRVLLPELVIGFDTLRKVPIDLEQPSQSPNLRWSILGMDVLKRFNVFVDYRNNVLYMKPNNLFLSNYSSPAKIWMIVLIILGLLIFSGVLYYLTRRSKNASINMG